MREIALLTFVTLDGVMQAPSMPDEDRSGGFDNGGWAAPYWEGVMAQVQREAMAEPYDILFGRKTYDLFASHWPDRPDDPAARVMNAARKYVVTSNGSGLTWANSTTVSGDLSGDLSYELTRLKRQDGPLLQVHGSWQLVQYLLGQDLVDEIRLWTFPIIVGTGKRLFEPGERTAELKLIKSEASSNGAVMSIYRRH